MPRERKVRHICCETINHRQYRTLTCETYCFLIEVSIAVAVSFGSKGLSCQFLEAFDLIDGSRGSLSYRLSQKNASDWLTDLL